MEAMSIIIGRLIGILITILVEYGRRPSLSLAIEEPPLDAAGPFGPAGPTKARHLRVRLINDTLPLCFDRCSGLPPCSVAAKSRFKSC